MTLDELNAMPPDQASAALRRCCGSDRWVREMMRRRPFPSRSGLQAAAREEWGKLDRSDWLEAFSHHPRIGERAAGWSQQEQSGAASASSETLARLAQRNGDYEQRFGHVFLICATGKSAKEMLANLEERMDNDPEHELRIAASEHAKITALRIDKLLGVDA